MGLVGRFFGKPKSRIGAEEFGRVLAEFAQTTEEKIPSALGLTLEVGEPDPIGISLVSASAVIWGAAHHAFVARLPEDRVSALLDAYYASVWERITSRFGSERAVYDEFVHRLGGLIMPDHVKNDWALRTGVHDILSVAVQQIGQAADEFVAASSDDRSAKGLGLGDAVGNVLLRGPDEVRVEVSILAYSLFMDVATGIGRYFQGLERQSVQIV